MESMPSNKEAGASVVLRVGIMTNEIMILSLFWVPETIASHIVRLTSA